MKRISSIGPSIIALLLVATCTTTATADWNEFWHNLHVGYHRNNAWPDPFNEVDAMQVVAPFEVMKRNGWRMHNTIGHELFREGDGALLASGSERVRWIATQAPMQRRAVYVLRGRNTRETQARVASVNATLATIRTPGPPARVLVTDVEPAKASGEWATTIQREMIKQIPAPRLPSTSSSGTQGAAVQQ